MQVRCALTTELPPLEIELLKGSKVSLLMSCGGKKLEGKKK